LTADPEPWFLTADPEPGSEIQCLFTLRSGSGIGKKSESGFGINNPDHISYSLETIFLVNIFKFFEDPGSGMKKKSDSGSGMEKKSDPGLKSRIRHTAYVDPKPVLWNRNRRNRKFLPCGSGTWTVTCQKVWTGHKSSHKHRV
jgi:hypothetical protein